MRFVSCRVRRRGQCGLCNYERGLMTENSLCVCVFIYFIFMSHISLRVYEILVISVSILFFFSFFLQNQLSICGHVCSMTCQKFYVGYNFYSELKHQNFTKSARPVHDKVAHTFKRKLKLTA